MSNEDIQSKQKQLKIGSQGKLWDSLNSKIDAAHEHLKVLNADVVSDNTKSIAHLHNRILQFQMGLRLALNTGWLIEQRPIFIQQFRDKIANDDPSPVQKALLEDKIKRLKKACNCSRKGCWKRGFIGINHSTGEVDLCTCTLQTIDIYNLEYAS